MLSQRVKARDPGNAFQTNERVQYCYIQVKGDEKKMLQGDLVETPTFATVVSKQPVTVSLAMYR